jgi:hypothetical protein
MFSFDLVLILGAVIVLAAWLTISRRARAICRASVTHMGRRCDVCPRTFRVTTHPK